VTPHLRGEGLAAGQGTEEYKLFSEDLGLGLVLPWVLKVQEPVPGVKRHLQEPPLVPGVAEEEANIYLRHNFDQWPPPRVEQLPWLSNPNPDLLWGTLNLLLLLGSVVPMYLTDKAARRKDRNEVILWLGVMILVSVLANAIRFVEFRHLNVRWDVNAYGSLVWLILGLHVTYLISAALEFFIMWLWVTTKDLDDHHAMDITLAAIYWYWIAGTWLILYVIVYLGARLL